MKPLVVLLLVLGSLAALVFALTALADSGPGRHEDQKGIAAVPSKPVTKDPTTLVEPASAPAVEQHPVETSRAPVQPDPDPSVRKGAFGAIEGKVVDEENQPVPKARISPLNTKPSSHGPDGYELRGTDPPRPMEKAETDEKGTFRFDNLDPRKDWSL